MKKSGLADSPFFPNPESQSLVTPPPLEEKTKKAGKPKPKEKKVLPDSNHDTVIPRYHDTMTPRYHDTVIEIVRKAVKDYGKEAATHRFTVSEKKAIADIIYTYKSRGVKTSENELARIAVNFLLEDFNENGEESVLDKVLRALNA